MLMKELTKLIENYWKFSNKFGSRRITTISRGWGPGGRYC